MPDTETRLAALGSCPEVFPICARWLYEEWGREQGYAFEDSLDWLRGIAAGGSDERGLAAYCDDQVAGVALLVACDLDLRPDLTPWLSSLFVAPAFRDRSIGRRLIEGTAAIARDQGHSRLYLYTDTAEAYYHGLGWRLEARFEKDGQPFALMSRPL